MNKLKHTVVAATLLLQLTFAFLLCCTLKIKPSPEIGCQAVRQRLTTVLSVRACACVCVCALAISSLKHKCLGSVHAVVCSQRCLAA